MRRPILISVGLYLLLTVLFSGLKAAVREPVVAGTFYPSDPLELKKMVTGHLDAVKAEPEIDGRILAILVPHAGLTYSGQIAAYSFKLLENSGFDKVILCGPSHQYGFSGISIYGPGIDWKTPLGTVNCDSAVCEEMLKKGRGISIIPQAYSREHSLEVELPYLQTVLKQFRIVPLIMGYQESGTIDELSRALETVDFDEHTVMVASTDWQHYRPASEGYKMDSLGMLCLSKLDPQALEKNLNDRKVEMCGGGPAVAVMKAAIARGANRVKILKYGDSGDMTGDKGSVVGYVAAVIYDSREKADPAPVEGSSKVSNNKELASKYDLSPANKKELLRISRQSIVSYLRDRTIPQFEVSGDLEKFGAAFVTLEENGQLRGCIGHTAAVEPLYKTVSICAIQAAVADPRFPPVKADETDRLHIEISVLTPMEKVKSFEEIRVGRDGLMVTRSNQSGLLLPQVATDYGWSITQFLEQTCLKAGLNPDSYKSPETVVYKFQAVIFGE